MRVLFCGDVCCNDYEYQREKLCDEELGKYINEHDYAFCNLEGPIVGDEEKKATKRGPHKHNGKQVKGMLSEAGFNAVTLANNHIMDYGIKGLEKTIGELEDSFDFIGAGKNIDEIYAPIILKKSGISVAVFSVGEKQYGVCSEDDNDGYAWMLHSYFIENLKKTAENCGYTVIICHCGAEELDVPLPEVKKIYRYFVDMGADLVIGHHPHVIQGCETYKEKQIYYSLGNFAFDNEDNSAYMPVGAVLSVDFSIDEKKIRCKLMETIYEGGIVHIKKDCKEFIEANNRLYSEDYNGIVREFCTDIYERCFGDYIALSIGLDLNDDDKMNKFFEYRKKGLPIKKDAPFIFHNTVVETNRWIIERAIGSIR